MVYRKHFIKGGSYVMKKNLLAVCLTAIILAIAGHENVYAAKIETPIQKEQPAQEAVLIEKNKPRSAGFADAETIAHGTTVNGTITEQEKERLYQITLPSAGKLEFDFTSYMKSYIIEVFDSNGTRIWNTDEWGLIWNDNLQYRKDVHSIDLTAGTYYIKVYGYARTLGSCTGTYNFTTKFIDAEETYQEPNNNFAMASEIPFNQTLQGQIALNDTEDIYRFSLAKDKKLTFYITSYMKSYVAEIFDSNGNSVWRTDEWGSFCNENVGYRNDEHEITLTAGNYYMKIIGYARTIGSCTGTYNFSIDTRVPIQNAEFSTIKAKTYTGQAIEPDIAITYNGAALTKNIDYEVSYTNNLSIGTAVLTVSGIGDFKGTETVNFQIAPQKGSITKLKNDNVKTANLTWKKDNAGCGYEIYRSAKKNSGYKKIKTISKNSTVTYKDTNLTQNKTYYYKVRAYKTINGTTYRGEFSDVKSVKITKISIKSTSISSVKTKTYTGKAIKPSVSIRCNDKNLTKNKDYTVSYENNTTVGTAAITITGKENYVGAIQIKFKILPQKTAILRLKNNSKKTVKLTWERDRAGCGYEIYRSVKSNTGYKKVKTIPENKTVNFKDTKLVKNKIYFYKVRAYKTVNGKKYYGSFSNPKSVNIRK